MTLMDFDPEGEVIDLGNFCHCREIACEVRIIFFTARQLMRLEVIASTFQAINNLVTARHNEVSKSVPIQMRKMVSANAVFLNDPERQIFKHLSANGL